MLVVKAGGYASASQSWFEAYPCNLLVLWHQKGLTFTQLRPAPASNGSWPSWPASSSKDWKNENGPKWLRMNESIFLIWIMNPISTQRGVAAVWFQEPQNQPRSPWDTAQALFDRCTRSTLNQDKGYVVSMSLSTATSANMREHLTFPGSITMVHSTKTLAIFSTLS